MAEKKVMILRRALAPPPAPPPIPSQQVPITGPRVARSNGGPRYRELTQSLEACIRAIREFGTTSAQVVAAMEDASRIFTEIRVREVSRTPPAAWAVNQPRDLTPARAIMAEDVNGNLAPYALVPCSQCSTLASCRADISCSRAPCDSVELEESEEFPSGARMILTADGDSIFERCPRCPTPGVCERARRCAWADHGVPEPGPDPVAPEDIPAITAPVDTVDGGTRDALVNVCGRCTSRRGCMRENRCRQHPPEISSTPIADAIGNFHRQAIDRALLGLSEEAASIADTEDSPVRPDYVRCFACPNPFRCDESGVCSRRARSSPFGGG